MIGILFGFYNSRISECDTKFPTWLPDTQSIN